MTPFLLKYLCDPNDFTELELKNEKIVAGNIVSGELVSSSGNQYPIINGIPRFLENVPAKTVNSFGNQWNYFNFTDYKINWLEHIVKNTFGNTEFFKDKIIIDAGGGSGAQSKWFLEYGAKHVIVMDLSHSVDDVIKENLKNYENKDIIQCSIDAPPIKRDSFRGLIYCLNVIQHTPSVKETARALYSVLAMGGILAVNCYQLNDRGVFRWIRHHLIHKSLRKILSSCPFIIILIYSHFLALFRLIPIIGLILEKLLVVARGHVPKIKNESFFSYIIRSYKLAVINTFDSFGSHKYQHYLRDSEFLKLCYELQPHKEKVKNVEHYLSKPYKIGASILIEK